MNQSDTGESLRVFVGDFEQKDANGNWVSVDPANIGGSAGFRPNIFATYSNDYFMFSQLENSTLFQEMALNVNRVFAIK